MYDTIKKCPKCNRRAYITGLFKHEDKEIHYYVECPECHYQGPVYSLSEQEYKDQSLVDEVLVRVVDHWNAAAHRSNSDE